MTKIFITGSSDGLGLMAGRLLAEQGHAVVLHARNEARAEDARARRCRKPKRCWSAISRRSGPCATSRIRRTRLGRFDAVIHNVGIGYREPRRVETVDGLSQLWAVNVLAPYVLTALMQKARPAWSISARACTPAATRASTICSGPARRWNGSQAYADTKLHDVLLAFGVARRWPDVLSNALTPGWVPTRMGGPGAPDDLEQGHLTQAWLAVSDDPAARVTGGYFYHQRVKDVNPAARDLNCRTGCSITAAICPALWSREELTRLCADQPSIKRRWLSGKTTPPLLRDGSCRALRTSCAGEADASVADKRARGWRVLTSLKPKRRSVRTKDALAGAKARGGGSAIFEGRAHSRTRAVGAIARSLARLLGRAERLRRLFEELKAEGITTANGIARVFNARM